MGSHPLNLLLRFVLEIATLAIAGTWGWKQSDGWMRFVLAIGIPIILAVIWATFAVPDDPSRSGTAPIVTSGLVRLMLELAFFAIATWALYDMELSKWSLAFGLVVILHYLVSYNRILWLISR